MFIHKNRSGYYDAHGQHSGKGEYLALFNWNRFKAMEEVQADCEYCQHRVSTLELTRTIAPTFMYQDAEHANALFNAYRSCSLHRDISVKDPECYANGKPVLYALVRKCSMHQCGNFMMGAIRVGGKSITVSGPIGSDGLPLNLQELPKDHRLRYVVRVPEDIAAAYWDNNGWNDVDANAAKVLRNWALNTFNPYGKQVGK